MIFTLPALTPLTVPSFATVAIFSSADLYVIFATLGIFLTASFVSSPTITSVAVVVNLSPALITEALAVRVLETFFPAFLAVTLTQYMGESYI